MVTILEVIEKDNSKDKKSNIGEIGINIDVMASWSYYSRKRTTTTRIHRPTSYYIRKASSFNRRPRRGYYWQFKRLFHSSPHHYQRYKHHSNKANTVLATAIVKRIKETRAKNNYVTVKRGLKPGIYTPYGYFKSSEDYAKFLVKKFPEIYVPKIRQIVSNWIRNGDPRLKDYWRNPEKWRAYWRKKYTKEIREAQEKEVEKIRRWKEQARKWILWYYALPKSEREKISRAIDERNKLLKELAKAERAGDWSKVNELKARIKQLDAIISGRGLSPNVPPPSILNEVKIQVTDEKWKEFRKNPAEYFNLIARIKELMAQKVTNPSLKEQLLSEAQKYRAIAQRMTSPLPTIEPITVPSFNLPSLPKLPPLTEIPKLISRKTGISEKYVKYGALALGGLILLVIMVKLFRREEEW